MEKKLTKKELFAKAIADTKDETLKDFFKHEIALLDKRTASKKENSENVEIKELILEVLETASNPMTITEIMKADTNLPQSNQKISSLVRQLKEDGIVERTEIKGRAYFSLAVTNDD
jgi:DNA-binding transcriptional regulator GbsR (MarR family)